MTNPGTGPGLTRRAVVTRGIAAAGASAFVPPAVVSRPTNAAADGPAPCPSDSPRPPSPSASPPASRPPTASSCGRGWPPTRSPPTAAAPCRRRTSRSAGSSRSTSGSAISSGRARRRRDRSAGTASTSSSTGWNRAGSTSTGSAPPRHLSPIGRTRTAPAPRSYQPVHFAVASCSNYEHGYFTAYRHLAESGPDLVFHLGDYLYETAPAARARRAGARRPADDDPDRVPAAPRAVQDGPRPAGRARGGAVGRLLRRPRRPRQLGRRGRPRAAPDRLRLPAIRAAAMQAYYENMPLREATRPIAGNMRCSAGWPGGAWRRSTSSTPASTATSRPAGAVTRPRAPTRLERHRSMLGFAQEAWLAPELAASDAAWDLLVQQVFFSPNELTPGAEGTPDDDGGPEHGHLGRLRRRRGTGCSPRCSRPASATRSCSAATCTPPGPGRSCATSSGGVRTRRGGAGDDLDQLRPRRPTPGTDWGEHGRSPTQPHLRFFDGRRGWTAVRVDARRAARRLPRRAVRARRGCPVTTSATFVVENGRPRLNRI